MDLLNLQLNSPNIQVAIRTLTVGGFILENFKRSPGYALFFMSRHDVFGIKQKYCFALFENKPGSTQIQTATIAASHNKAELVIISPVVIKEIPNIEWKRFLNLFGGPVNSYTPLESDFAEHLMKLAFNKLPAGLTGKPDDLFELYIQRAFEFIFGCKVHRYGQERRFEARPDGIIIQDKTFSSIYDTKAYSNGFEITLDSIRQFSSYTSDFRSRYNHFFDLHSFIVVSGKFPHTKRTLENKSRQFLSEANIPLAFITAETIISIIDLLADFPSARRSINWRKIFVNPIIVPDLVQSELKLISKDKIIMEGKI